MNNRISDLEGLRHYFGEQIEQIDKSCYRLHFEDLVDEGTHNFLDLLRRYYDWKWNDDIPGELTADEIFECISEYECEKHPTLLELLKTLLNDDTVALCDGAQTWYVQTLIGELDNNTLEMGAYFNGECGICLLNHGGDFIKSVPDYCILNGEWNDDGEFEELS
jgi:hypothetical protein